MLYAYKFTLDFDNHSSFKPYPLLSLKNMIKYYHLFKFARSKGFPVSNKKWFYQSSFIRSQHFLCYPQQPQPPVEVPHPTENVRNICYGTTLSYVTQYRSNHHHAQLPTLHKPSFPDHDGGNRHDYHVSIKDRDVICAAHGPKFEYWLPQSNLDLLLPPHHAGVFFCYQKQKDTSMSPETVIKTIKNSLSEVLSTFYPLAGEIVPNSQGEPEVLCNNSGVEFVYAHADVELENLDLHHPDETVNGKLVPDLNRGILSVQVTEFNCGAITVSCTFDHRIGDGTSLNMFLVAWAEYARFKKISNIPSFRRSILNPRRPPHYNTVYDDFYLHLSSLPPPPSEENKPHSRIYYIHAESINNLQHEASSKEIRRSKLQSFVAFIWKLIAQEGHNEPNKTSRMGVVVDGRKHLSGNREQVSSMLANHFGNVVSIPYGVLSNQHLQEMQLSEVATKVNKFVTDATQEEHFRGLIDWVELHRPQPAFARINLKLQENDGDTIVVSSGQGLPISETNFGWAQPYFGSYHFPWGGHTGYISTMPSTKKNGDWIVYAHLKQKHLDLIESKAQHVFNPITHSYLRFH
ncbi:putative alcohol O-acetyltransferase [Helianthus annuus]|nr:putative alcohol O-acetyltransferase [Helianthus annuus]KAJ0599585.1 putative alcohol O-acetyltransferase [Helianthus annuus]KAJ0607120.1 putative alcohol O-acetyltransferase [Helianthus annuus]KAJ0767174.1 putative alcohol O-acetyltransferase [Helianthus annuus]KAJ0773026.1 putative alcohol O-acetyltransferase [Helianthus annuus]